MDWSFEDGTTYPQDEGLVLDLPQDRGLVLEILEAAEGSEWLNEKTRTVTVDFTIYNWQLDLATAAHVFFEFLPAGGLSTTVSAYATRLPHTTELRAETAGVLLDLSLFILTVYLSWVEVSEFFSKRKEYINDVLVSV